MELYVHVPFCRKKCRYCDFVSFPGSEQLMAEYVNGLLREAAERIDDITEPVETVYFGGGTPSLLPAALLSKLIQGLKSILPLDQVCEWTSEANPGTLTLPWLEVARSSGINRLSIGMQAAQNDILKKLGRIHTLEDVEKSVSLARQSGFSNISLDLIFGLPAQNKKDWMETLQAALTLFPEHISAYGLIPEEGTPLFEDLKAKRLLQPEVEQEREMYDILLQFMAENGFKQYEISNFARPGYQCQHNIGYWTQIPYLGLGLSAASMIRPVRKEGFSYQRSVNTSNLTDWLSGNYSDSIEVVSPDEARFETMMLGLRMNEGVSEITFEDLHHISLERCYGHKLHSLALKGLVQYRKPFWSLTRLGMDLQNLVLVELMDDP